MILQAQSGHYLTEAADVPIKERSFHLSVLVSDAEEANGWKEVSESEKERILAESALFDPESMDYGYLEKLEGVMGLVRDNINTIPMSESQALSKKVFFPLWENILGKDVGKGFRFRRADNLFECLVAHELSIDNDPIRILSTLEEFPESNPCSEYYKLLQDK